MKNRIPGGSKNVQSSVELNKPLHEIQVTFLDGYVQGYFSVGRVAHINGTEKYFYFTIFLSL